VLSCCNDPMQGGAWLCGDTSGCPGGGCDLLAAGPHSVVAGGSWRAIFPRVPFLCFHETKPKAETSGKREGLPLLNVSSGLAHHRREVLVASMGLQVLVEMPVCFSFKKKRVYDQERLWDS